MGKPTARGEQIPYVRLIPDHGCITTSILHYQYDGSGAEADHVLLDGLRMTRNTLDGSNLRRWLWTLLESITILAVALTTSA